MYKSKTTPDCFFFNNKEEEAMKVLWAANRPLSATEIAEGIPNRQWPISSIQNILRNLEKKQAIEVVEIVKLGKTYGRLFAPTLSTNEYAAMQFKRYYHQDNKNHLSLISSLLGQFSNKQEIVTLLENLLAKYKED